MLPVALNLLFQSPTEGYEHEASDISARSQGVRHNRHLRYNAIEFRLQSRIDGACVDGILDGAGRRLLLLFRAFREDG
jgi:hypothetical protein